MPSQDASPYDTRLNVQFPPLELIDEKALTDSVVHPWFNQTLCQVNDSVVRVGAIQGEYHWHKHDNDDEFFYVIDGQLLVDLRDRTITLSLGRESLFQKASNTEPELRNAR